MKWYRSVKFKTFLLLTATMLWIVSVFFIVISDKLEKQFEEEVYARNMDVAHMLTESFDLFFSDIKFNVSTLTEAKEVQSYSFLETDRFLRQIVRMNENISQIFLIDKEGMQYYKTSHLDTLGSRLDRTYFHEAIKGQTYVSDVIVSRSTGQPIAVVAAPIYVDEELTGVIGASIDLSSLERFLQVYNKENEKYAFVVDHKGKVIFHPTINMEDEISDVSYLTPVKNVIAGREGIAKYIYNGKEKLVAYLQMHETGWGILAQTPTKIAFKPVVEIQRWMILLFFTALVMIIISGYSLSRYLTKPIQEMIKGIKRIHSNRQKVYFEQHWNDEFGLLQNEFIQLMTALNEAHDSMEDQVRQRTWQLTQTNDALRDSNEKLNKAIFELKEAQEKLIESEKLSALGRISVRISHELNTPLGICITSASYLQGQLRQIKNKKRKLGGEEKDSDLEAILEFEESLELIMVQLKKSKGIIDYLKEMPVEYQVKSIKHISVRNEIEGALRTFETAGSELERVVHLNCPLETTTRSYEGALQEVFEKLIDNTLKHGCMLEKACQITIDVKPFKGGIEIEYRDNGTGIDADLLNYIFEPLYKKSMGMKGAGMGLTRVYQLVKNLLGGELSISNGDGGGTVIHMVLNDHV